jgi:NADPH:quinone reductase-like Zn-dependent oxidoreductase
MTTRQPQTARSARFHRYGPPDVLAIHRTPFPRAGAGEVVVRVHAAGVNPKDAMIRSGALRLQTGRTFPRGTGFDLAGQVVAAGADVGDLRLGTHVWGFLDGALGGTAADFVVVPRSSVAPMPSRLGWIEAGAMPLAASAALQALRDVARLQSGERVLIRGASGGVGSAAIQIARAWGAHVTAITHGAAAAHCVALGAHRIVDRNAETPDLEGPYDVYLDCVGGSSLLRYGSLLRRGGRWVTVAPSLPVFAAAPLTRILAPLGLFARLDFVVVRPVVRDLDALRRMVEDGRLTMPIAAIYPLEDVRAAHGDVATGGGRGKRVLAISPEALQESHVRHNPPVAGAA